MLLESTMAREDLSLIREKETQKPRSVKGDVSLFSHKNMAMKPNRERTRVREAAFIEEVLSMSF